MKEITRNMQPFQQSEVFGDEAEKKKLFGCPPTPAPNFWKLENDFTVQKNTGPNFQNSKKKKKKKTFFFFFFFFWEFWSFNT